MENPERLVRSSRKEQINISQFGAHLLKNFIAFRILGGKQILKRSLLKEKYESYLKEIEINPDRIESYLLDSLWKKLQNSVKNEGRNLVSQKFQPYIPPTVQTPPAFQAPPFVPNPPK